MTNEKDIKVTVAASVRRDVADKLDAIRPVLSTKWHKATRADAVRAILAIGLQHFDPKIVRQEWQKKFS